MPSRCIITEIDELIKLTKDVKNSKDADQLERKVRDTTDDTNAKYRNGVPTEKWLELTLLLLAAPYKGCVEAAEDILRSKDCIKWKEAPNGGAQILQQLKDNNPRFIYEPYHSFVEQMVRQIEKLPAGRKVSKVAFELLVKAIDTRHFYFAACVPIWPSNLLELIDFKKIDMKSKEDLVDSIKKAFQHQTTVTGKKEEEYFNTIIQSGIWIVLYNEKEHLPSASTTELTAKVYDLFAWLDRQDLTTNEGKLNLYGKAYFSILDRLLLGNYSNISSMLPYIKKFGPHVAKWSKMDAEDLDEGMLSIQKYSKHFVDRVMTLQPDFFQDQTDDMVKQYLKNNEIAKLGQVYKISENDRMEIHNGIKPAIDLLMSNDSNKQLDSVRFLTAVSEHHPEVLLPYLKQIETLIGKEMVDTYSVVANMAKVMPQKLKGIGDDYFDRCRKLAPTMAVAYVHGIFSHLITLDRDEGNRIFLLEKKEIEMNPDDKNFMILILCQWTQLAMVYPHLLKKHKKYLEAFVDDPITKQAAQILIDNLEGRSLQKVSTDIEHQKENIDELEERVDDVEENAEMLEHEINVHGKRIAETEVGVLKSSKQIRHLEEQVDEIEDDVSELENKTVSNAPRWSKKVSSLLNPASSADWCLVAKRLGYSNIDVRHWATQSDPCMSMLAEFYTTNKTSEATHFLLTTLKQINRLDVVEIIEAANESSKNVVTDGPAAYEKPPVIFLSYQWAHQKEIKLLKSYLEKEGFSCWMDIGQMGGGDSLYEEIDKGIRGSKVVLLCMNVKYCSSPNCIREVNLSNGLGKRIIPLQLEKLPWPPEGSLGPILAEKLFIRFYQRDHEKTNDERFWPAAMYGQLLTQIKEFVEPDIKKQPINGRRASSDVKLPSINNSNKAKPNPEEIYDQVKQEEDWKLPPIAQGPRASVVSLI